MFIVLWIILTWIVLNLVLIAGYHKSLIRLWKEPVFKKPIVIFESDDWGAGPLEQVGALDKLVECLSKYKDSKGQHPVMTLALTLSIADTRALAKNDLLEYKGLDIDHEIFTPLLESIENGVDKKIFALQLHGKEHYWPDSLIQSAKYDYSVKNWLTQEDIPYTEALPSYLQSRWIDATTLPSGRLHTNAIKKAVDEEVALFKRIFGQIPRVVVPPTFVWSSSVEKAWQANGVQTIVTPGRRMKSRNRDGAPVASGPVIVNGMQGENGINYIVRDEYFEPNFGHQAQDKLLCIEHKMLQGRPVLFETHRFNYVGEKQSDSLNELDKLVSLVLSQFPRVRFMSTEKLADVIQKRDGEFIESGVLNRLKVWIQRINSVSGFGRIARLTGLAMILKLVCRAL